MTVFVVLIWIFCAIVASAIAKNKNRDRVGWFILGALFGPFAFVVALLPALSAYDELPDKKCPYCAEMIKAEAVKCRFCGADIPVIAISPNASCTKCGYKPLRTSIKKDGTKGAECPICGIFYPVQE